ncbi:caspase domain-containing protein [Mycena rebaudengoi]|nr:caspase domain-containing protein [Mycena rebaudengoi]
MDHKSRRPGTLIPTIFEQSDSPTLHSSSSSSNSPCMPNVVGKKKALLIAIASELPGYPALHGAHRDVRAMRELLLKMYDYQPSDITLLIDDEIADHPQPTRANILKAMADLIEDAKSGDEFFFHYCGHSMQIENHTDSEEDGKDECFVPLDGEEMRIVDNVNLPIVDVDRFLTYVLFSTQEIHKILVVPLPIGSRLVTVLDTCHSGSLLDLKHYRCNRVWIPWLYKGTRSSEAYHSMIVRRNALASSGSATFATRRVVQTSRTSSSSVRTKHTLIDVGETQQPTQSVPQSPIDALPHRVSSRTPGGTPVGSRATISRLRTTSIRCPLGSIENNQADVNAPPLVQLVEKSRFLPDDALVCDSPISRWPCDGWCRDSGRVHADDGVKADVVSLAACRDEELAWDDATGFSMSRALIEILQAEPNPTLKNLVTKLSHGLRKLAFVRHGNLRDNKTKRNDYEAILKERIAINKGSTVSLSTQSSATPSPLAPVKTFPAPTRRQSKQLARDLRALKKSREAKGQYDQNAFQHPELSSPLPLNMETRWRM